MSASRNIAEILAGYVNKADAADLAKLVARTDWAELAKWEEARRAARLLAMFDDDDLARIASGQINLPSLLEEADAEQKGGR